jgi:serine/threonine protein kinase
VLKDGRYVLLRKLGEGSQGETYEAMDHGVGPAARERAAREAPLADKWRRYVRAQESGGAVPQDARLVAIKCFRVGTAKSWKDVELAEREARTLASLEHPKLPRYFEHFEEDGALYLVMEKIEGESLASLRKQGCAMSAADVTRMLEELADALRYLHGRAPLVVHRDIKPGNVIRRADGSFVLVDFGAVRDRLKPTGGSTVVGTFGYMAPEQFQGRASPASDVYGLGATAITMLTGVDPEELPHRGLGIDVAKALPSGTPAALVRALTAMLVPDPDARASSADEVLALLRGPAMATATDMATAMPSLEGSSAAGASPDPRERGPERHPLALRPAQRFFGLVAIAAMWMAVYVMLRTSGHQPVQTALAIAMAVLVTVSIRSAAGRARRRRVPRGTNRREAGGAAGRVRVADEPKRVRAVTEDAFPEHETTAEDAPEEESTQKRRRR